MTLFSWKKYGDFSKGFKIGNAQKYVKIYNPWLTPLRIRRNKKG